MSWNFLVQIPTLFRYLFGPFNQPLCLLDMTIRNALLMQGLMYIDATMIIRYIFIFLMKNPTALQDDFWRLFLVIWTSSFTAISQIIFVYTPGKSPHNYFICLGSFPIKYIGVGIKPNFPLTILLIFSLAVLLIAGPRIKMYQKQEEAKDLIYVISTSQSSKGWELRHSCIMYSLLSRCCTTRGSSTGFSLVGPTNIKAG